MAENTKIQWCDHTWSPHRGCAKLSPGCAKCYAERGSHRNPGIFGTWGPNGKRIINSDWNKPLIWDRKAAKDGRTLRIFPSVCDPFEDREDLDESRSRFLELIEKTPHLTWLLLTKRPECWRPTMQRLADVGVSDGQCLAESWLDGEPPKNVWLGVSVENQEYADERLPILEQIPAVIRWVSYEPALGPVEFTPYLNFIDWIVCGGESGHDARPFNVAWARMVVDQCRAAGISPYIKQLGSAPYAFTRTGVEGVRRQMKIDLKDSKGGDMEEWGEAFDCIKVREFPGVKV